MKLNQRKIFVSLLIIILMIFGTVLFGRVAVARTIYAIIAPTELLTFDSASPNIIPSSPITITGLQTSEMIFCIDFRTDTGELYGVGSTSRLYKIDPTTAVATEVGSGPFSPGLNGSFFGCDFSPVSNLLRVVSDLDQNLRLDPDTGAVLSGMADTSLSPPSDVVGIAFDQNFFGATQTTVFGIDAGSDMLVTIGGLIGSPSPNLGTVIGRGALGVVTSTNDVGFDIAPDGTAFASLNVNGVSQFYTINLSTGAASLVNTIGNGAQLIPDIAVLPLPGALQFSAATYSVSEGAGTVTITITRTGGSDGDVSVQFATSDGTAMAGSDYTAVTQTVTFANQDTADKTVTIPILNDTTVEGDETVDLTLSNPTGGATLGTPNPALLTISDLAEVCGNGLDDDGDGLVDCNDSDCATGPVCDFDVGGGGCSLQNHSVSNIPVQLHLFLTLAGLGWKRRKSKR